VFRVVVSRLGEIESRFVVLLIPGVPFARFGNFVVAEARGAFVELDLLAERHPVGAFDDLAVLVCNHARASKMICCQITYLRRRYRIIARQGRVFRDKLTASIINEHGRLRR